MASEADGGGGGGGDGGGDDDNDDDAVGGGGNDEDGCGTEGGASLVERDSGVTRGRGGGGVVPAWRAFASPARRMRDRSGADPSLGCSRVPYGLASASER